MRRFASFSELAAYFERVATRLPGAETQWLEQIGTLVEAKMHEKPGTYQAGWAALAAATLADKAKRGYPVPSPLLRTGAMKGSYQHSVSARKMIAGTNDHKAIFHELGTSKMPPRPVVGPAMKESLPQVKTIIIAGLRTVFQTS